MHKHDPALIAALADGTLDDETEGRALVETCDECRAEYESQTAILGLLAGTPPVRMTEHEKAALHRDLWTALRSDPSAAPAPTPWWHRWSYVAAGLLVVVGLVSVLGGLPGSQMGDETATTAAEAAPADDGRATFQTDADASGAGSEESTETTVSAAAETLSVDFADAADEARARAQTADRSRYATQSLPEEVDACLQSAGLTEHVVVDELDLDRRYLVVMPREPGPDSTVTFVVKDTCEIAYVDG